MDMSQLNESLFLTGFVHLPPIPLCPVHVPFRPDLRT
jgi:hypothetical protein